MKLLKLFGIVLLAIGLAFPFLPGLTLSKDASECIILTHTRWQPQTTQCFKVIDAVKSGQKIVKISDTRGDDVVIVVSKINLIYFRD